MATISQRQAVRALEQLDALRESFASSLPSGLDDDALGDGDESQEVEDSQAEEEDDLGLYKTRNMHDESEDSDLEDLPRPAPAPKSEPADDPLEEVSEGYTLPDFLATAPDFHDWDVLKAYHLAHSRQNGFVASTRQVRYKDYKDKLHWAKAGKIRCGKSGEYYGHEGHREEDLSDEETATTRKTNCPYEICYAWAQKQGRYKVNGTPNLHHNHPPDNPEVYSRHRKLTGEELQYARSLVAKNPPSTALEHLRHRFPSCMATYDDIRNLQLKVWAEDRQGLSDTQALLRALAIVQMIVVPWKDPSTNELLGVLITDPMAVILAQEYGHTLQMDCTYKTNKYNMPLLHIVSHSSTGTTFSVAYCFMKQETGAYYAHALRILLDVIPDLPTKVVVTDADRALQNALAEVCPDWKHLHCRWHITQNIKAKCRLGLLAEEWQQFTALWNDIVFAPTESDFEEACAKFKRAFDNDENTQHLYDYVMSRLKEGKREMFVACWVDNYPHLDNTSSSRAEGAHSHLKRKLRSCRGDLTTTVGVLRSGMVDQQRKVFEKMNKERSRKPCLNKAWFKHLFGKVSRKALFILNRHRRMALKWARPIQEGDMTRDDVPACNCHLQESMGLPCCHMLLDKYLQDETAITLNELHEHWRLKDPRALEKMATEKATDDMRIGRNNLGNVQAEQRAATAGPSSARVKREDTPIAALDNEPIVISDSDDSSAEVQQHAAPRRGSPSPQRPSKRQKRSKGQEVRRVLSMVNNPKRTQRILADDSEEDDSLGRMNALINAPSDNYAPVHPTMSGVPNPIGVRQPRTSLTQEELDSFDEYESPAESRTLRTRLKKRGGVTRRVSMRHMPTTAERVQARVDRQEKEADRVSSARSQMQADGRTRRPRPVRRGGATQAATQSAATSAPTDLPRPSSPVPPRAATPSTSPIDDHNPPSDNDAIAAAHTRIPSTAPAVVGVSTVRSASGTAATSRTTKSNKGKGREPGPVVSADQYRAGIMNSMQQRPPASMMQYTPYATHQPFPPNPLYAPAGYPAMHQGYQPFPPFMHPSMPYPIHPNGFPQPQPHHFLPAPNPGTAPTAPAQMEGGRDQPGLTGNTETPADQRR